MLSTTPMTYADRFARFAKRAVALRFGPKKIEKPDMMQAFLRHGLTQREAETEGALQMWVAV